MWSEKIKENCRIIHTGLYGGMMKAIIDSVEGQLSDGMWEDSMVMRGYWLFECCDLNKDGEVVIYVSKSWGDNDFNKMRYNKFSEMSDSAIREWFANKIKQIVKKEQEWNNANIKWDRNCMEGLDYFHTYNNKQITVQAAYYAYDNLKARGNIHWYGKNVTIYQSK